MPRQCVIRGFRWYGEWRFDVHEKICTARGISEAGREGTRAKHDEGTMNRAATVVVMRIGRRDRNSRLAMTRKCLGRAEMTMREWHRPFVGESPTMMVRTIPQELHGSADCFVVLALLTSLAWTEVQQ